MKCKITGDDISPFMSFGKMPLANGFIEKKNFSKEFFYEMEVGFSKKLSLFQLNDFPNPKKMFNKEYPFYTGSSMHMKTHFKDYADWIKKEYLKNGSRLIGLTATPVRNMSGKENNDLKEFYGGMEHFIEFRFPEKYGNMIDYLQKNSFLSKYLYKLL